MDLSYLTYIFLKCFPNSLEYASDINDGQCYNFAYWVMKLHGGKLISVAILVETEVENDYKEYCAHAFVELNGKFYDSESPCGVNNWEDLEFFKREISYLENQDNEFSLQVFRHKSVKHYLSYWGTDKEELNFDQKMIKKIALRKFYGKI